MEGEIIPKGQEHAINLEKELLVLLEFFGIDPKKDKLALNIFLELISPKGREGVKTIDLVRKYSVTQAACVYHLNKFMDQGIAQKKGRYYFLRGENLTQTIDEIERDYIRKMERVRKVAKRIDDFL